MHAVDPTLRYDMVRAEQAHRMARSARAQMVSTRSSQKPHTHTGDARFPLRHRLAVAAATALVLLASAASAWVAGSNNSQAADAAEPVPCVRAGAGWAC